MLHVVPRLLLLLLAILAFLGKRWAYLAYIIVALLWIPALAHVRLMLPPSCEYRFGVGLALHSFRNFPHIILFAIFFVMTVVQFGGTRRSLLLATLMCIVMGMLVEWEEGATGIGHCRVRDLIPDTTGAVVGAVLCVGWEKVRGGRRRV